MKKFLNSVDTVLTESLDGFVAAHADILVLGDEHKFVRRRTLKPGKVALISGLFIVKNYEGDVMNFEMAAEMSEGVMQVVTNDDVAVENSSYTTGRRGVAGTLVVEKILGAAAEQGMALKPLKALGERVNGATRSMGVALTSCTVPAAGKPTFDIGYGEMEFGVGIHGEPGRRRDTLKSADAIAEEICA
ncbi:MAG: dihydroxyacetone kinase subunit DhaK, partial [Mesorhizobium sp.]